ncbi:MAG: GNAT family N-acetyltransferase [Legionellaceae bacterium]|nr:GNAT family N-acetyltransferase [Legionellaceae bacterium]
MVNKQYSIAQIKKHEMSIIISLAANEGWNPGLYDEKCFYQADPNGFFLGKLGDKVIAVGSGVKYKNEFAFFGLYIVEQAYRGRGYGMDLTKAIFQYMGDINIGLDGVPDMQNKYEKFGFKIAHYNARYCGKLKTYLLLNEAIVDMASIPLEVLFEFDRQYFPAQRDDFLKSWLAQPDSKALGYWQRDKLLGYGVIRRCIRGFKIGPLFAKSPEIADALFLSLTAHANGEEIFLDVIEDNIEAIRLVNRHGLEKVFTTARMYTKQQPNINIQHIYGITTFELG